MKTSKIKIRPFQSYKEPCAVLTYGNVTIELEYTALLKIRADNGNGLWYRFDSVVNAAIKEVIREMDVNMEGKTPELHRDGKHPAVESPDRNHLHPCYGEVVEHKNKKETTSPCPYGTGVDGE